jgi:DNA-binding CsgD family transcriptional regulator
MTLDELAPRQREVVQHIADGYSYREIGELMKISPNTVHVHVYRLMQMTGTENRHRLVMHFYRIVPATSN